MYSLDKRAHLRRKVFPGGYLWETAVLLVKDCTLETAVRLGIKAWLVGALTLSDHIMVLQFFLLTTLRPGMLNIKVSSYFLSSFS